MRVAFYAPLKPPAHPVASGDRRIARLLLRALRMLGSDVRVVSTFRSFEGDGDRAKQAAIRRRGCAEARRLLHTTMKRWRPDVWFTYHLYQKAPDWLGPPIARELAIPYVVAEAAYAPRRAEGRWDEGLAAVADALRQADTAFVLNPNDEECVAPLLPRRADAVHTLHGFFLSKDDFPAWRKRAARRPAAVEPLLPFVDTGPYWRARQRRGAHRAAVARKYGLPFDEPWLLAVGMMRDGDKLASYRMLARALAGLTARPWRLLVVGDGPARREVRRAFRPIDDRVRFVGLLPEQALMPIYAASNLFVWPAVNEAIGMAVLEAQAAGLPAVAGDVGAVGVIVGHDWSGLLTPEGNLAQFRGAIEALLADRRRRAKMANGALVKSSLFHHIDFAASHLNEVLVRAVRRARRRERR